MEQKVHNEESWAAFQSTQEFDLLFRASHLTIKGGSVCDEIEFSPKVSLKLPSSESPLMSTEQPKIC